MVVLSEVPEGSSSSSSTHGHSSSTSGQSSSAHVHTYDVFLSFRGVDTRHSFTDHLHKALLDANITTFLDDEEIETGEHLKPGLESAIKASRASIIVLSKNYATSTWCLDELVLILEQCVTSNHIVIPIFYHVEPTHVRKQEDNFGDAMAKHKKTMEAEKDANKKSQWAQKMDRWSKALTEVASLKGKDVKGRLETEFIEEVVKDIHHRLHLYLRSAQLLPTGMDYAVNFVTSWLRDASSHNADILTISGIGGIGKTHLAQYVFKQYCFEYKKSSFIEDISRRCDGKFNGLLDLQKQLCDDISKASSVQLHNVSMYTSKIEHVIAHKRVFIVLDDIDSIEQLDALLGSKGVHPGSKVIVTTKNASLTQNCSLLKKNIKPKHAELLLKGLNETESIKLLCLHAFQCNHPKEGYGKVSYKLVKYCQGHPLALEVLGKSLYNRDIAYWEGYIEGLKKETDSRVNNVLRMSFDSLPSNNDKELFKYIACFFVGVDRDISETILNACGINTRSGITNLVDRFLLSIGWNNELKMHQLVQEMGKSEVRQESIDKPWKRSRLWCHKESFRVLKRKKGKGNVVGLALDMRMLEKEQLGASHELKTDALSEMDSLKLLQLDYVHMSGSYRNFPEELRCLRMHGFSLKSIPSDLPIENLVALDMSYSNIESFFGCYSNPNRPEKRQKLDGSYIKYKRSFRSLKILNLSFCRKLHTLGDFDQLPILERLIVRRCISLVEVCESIEHCIELVYIDMSYCKKVEKIPRTIGMLKKLKTALLDGCNLGESRTENTNMDSLQMCKANENIGINAITFLRFVVTLSLANNNLLTESFPKDFSRLSMLKELYLDGNPMDSMPKCLRTLPRIEILSMDKCDKLKSVEHPPHTLRKLWLVSNPKLEKVTFDQEMSTLGFFYPFHNWFPFPWYNYRHWSHEVEGMVKVQRMEDVEEKVLRHLGWINLDFRNIRRMKTGTLESKMQMIYEFGIFSTLYEQEEMPQWFKHRSVVPSIYFTIPSSPNNLRGLDFCCCVQTSLIPYDQRFYVAGQFPNTPMITVSNITKNRMWIYESRWYIFYKGGKCQVLLTHWMFGRNEMEGGDHVMINVTLPYGMAVKECGVRVVYDDDGEEEEDALGYYKSWNHIIGGDLSPFQTTTGQYILDHDQFFQPFIRVRSYHRKFIPEGPNFQANKMKPWFRALSPRKPDINGGTREGKGESSSSRPSHGLHMEMFEKKSQHGYLN